MEYAPLNSYDELTRPIVQVWDGQIRRAMEAKKVFNERGAQVMSFYSGGAGAMWEPDYMQRFMGSSTAIAKPKFKITLNVAFEQVAIFGPLLYWQMADRKVRPHRTLQLDPNVLAGGDSQAAEYFNQLAEQQASEDAKNEMRSKVLEHMLNYFQREQFGGGLAPHSELAIFEALTKGAGFLKTEQYQFPFSERTLVGSFFQPCDDVLVDPDCRDPLWTTARWIAIRHVSKYFEVEEHFGLPPGSMRAYSTQSSNGAAYQSGGAPDTKVTVTKDLIEWYEVFSRAGFGNKLAGTRETIPREFDEARGYEMIGGKLVKNDFAYLCICPGCNFPLNLSSREMVQEYATPEWVKQKTDWPTEYWRDNKWPIEMLSFYPHSGTSPWPEPPLAPALGELTCLNILMSAYVEQAYENRQTIGVYKKGAIENLQALKNATESPLWVEVSPELKETLTDIIAFAERPEVNADLPTTIQFIIGLIEKRTGLSPVLYGQAEGAEPRSATAYQGRQDTVNIRPEHMQKKVAAWQSGVADKEVLCAYIHVAADDIAEQLGPIGVPAWEMLVTNESPEAILRGSKCVVEASDIRRPNKAKDMGDLQGMQQYLVPILAGHMAQTGDVGPMNGFIEAIGDAGEIDVTKFLFPPQQPDENAQQMQQAELAKTQAEIEKLTAEAQKTSVEAQVAAGSAQQAQQDAALKAQVAQHGMMLKQQTAEHGLAVKGQQAQLAQVSKQQEMLNRQGVHEQTMEERQQQAQQKLGLEILKAHQGLQTNAATHYQQTAIEDQKAQDEAKRGNMIMYSKMMASAAQHAQQMQQKPAQGATT